MGSEHAVQQGQRKPARVPVVLAVLWVAEVEASRRLKVLAERVKDRNIRACLGVLQWRSQQHGQRLMVRLSAQGVRGPTPLPRESEDLHLDRDLALELRREARLARALAQRYKALSERTRKEAGHDISTAWVCDLCFTETTDTARELMALAETLEQEVDHG